jgi:hypothetical protein
MSEKTFVIMNKLAGLSWYLSDEKAVIGRYTDPTDREKVRIAYPFDNFSTQCTHNISVGRRVPRRSPGLYQVKGRQPVRRI